MTGADNQQYRDEVGELIANYVVNVSGKLDPRAKKIRPQDLVDRRYLDSFQKSGFFDKLWAGK